MIDEPTTLAKPETPFDLVRMAIDKDLDVDKLERLLDMQKQWQADQSRQAYFDAMNRVQASLPRVIKDKENNHTHSRYASLEAVNSLVLPRFNEGGFSISFNELDCEVPDSIKLLATVRHNGGHQEEFTAIIPIDSAGAKGTTNKNPTQAKGSTIAYGRRYLMLMIGNVIVQDEDTDGNAEELKMTEEQCIVIRAKLHDHVNIGVSKLTYDAEESRFVGWLAKEQREDITTLEQVHSRLFPRAVAALDAKMRKHQAESPA